MKYLVYGLKDPTTGLIRYIGKSCQGFRRPKAHWTTKTELAFQTPKARWIRKLLRKNLIPIIEVLAFCTTAEETSLKEIELIAFHKKQGTPLLNLTKGGVGGDAGGGKSKHKSVVSINTKTGEKKFYEFINAVAKDGFSPSHVSAVCLNKEPQHKGCFFYFGNLSTEAPIIPTYKTRRALVAQHKITGEKRIFKSIKEAAIGLNLATTTISFAVNGHSENSLYIFSDHSSTKHILKKKKGIRKNNKILKSRLQTREIKLKMVTSRGCLPFLVFTKDENRFVGEWISLSLCAQDLKLGKHAPSGITKVLHGKQKSVEGYIFKYKE